MMSKTICVNQELEKLPLADNEIQIKDFSFTKNVNQPITTIQVNMVLVVGGEILCIEKKKIYDSGVSPQSPIFEILWGTFEDLVKKRYSKISDFLEKTKIEGLTLNMIASDGEYKVQTVLFGKYFHKNFTVSAQGGDIILNFVEVIRKAFIWLIVRWKRFKK